MSMANLNADITRAIYTHVDSWLKPVPIDVVFPYMKYTPTMKPYARVNILHNINQRLTMGDGGLTLLRGIAQVTFIYQLPTDYSEPSILEHIGSMAEHFKSDTRLMVQSGIFLRITKMPDYGQMFINADRIESPLSIDWQVTA